MWGELGVPQRWHRVGGGETSGLSAHLAKSSHQTAVQLPRLKPLTKIKGAVTPPLVKEST